MHVRNTSRPRPLTNWQLWFVCQGTGPKRRV